LAPCSSASSVNFALYAAANFFDASLTSLLRYGELTIVPSAFFAPAVSMKTGVPCGAAPAKVAVMPRSRACLTIRPDSTSSAPRKITLGFFWRIPVSTALKSFCSVVTTWSASGVTPRLCRALRNASCSPLPYPPLLVIIAMLLMPCWSTMCLASVSSYVVLVGPLRKRNSLPTPTRPGDWPEVMFGISACLRMGAMAMVTALSAVPIMAT
jgi:hypothetical protein